MSRFQLAPHTPRFWQTCRNDGSSMTEKMNCAPPSISAFVACVAFCGSKNELIMTA